MISGLLTNTVHAFCSVHIMISGLPINTVNACLLFCVIMIARLLINTVHVFWLFCSKGETK